MTRRLVANPPSGRRTVLGPDRRELSGVWAADVRRSSVGASEVFAIADFFFFFFKNKVTKQQFSGSFSTEWACPSQGPTNDSP